MEQKKVVLLEWLILKLFLGEKAKSRVLILRPRHVVNSESNLVKKS
jgi:hypothetical protein